MVFLSGNFLIATSSLPGLTRQFIFMKKMDARVRPAPDNLRRLRPRLRRPPQALERLGHAEHAEIVEAAADDLHADRKAAFAEAAVDRGGRIFRHVPGHGIAD